MSYIILKNGQSIKKVSVHHIYYVTTHPTRAHFLVFVTKEGELSVPGSLSQLQADYPHLLMRCHRKYLVNKFKIAGFDLKKRLLIFDDEELAAIACSRSQFGRIKSEWLATKGEMK